MIVKHICFKSKQTEELRIWPGVPQNYDPIKWPAFHRHDPRIRSQF